MNLSKIYKNYKPDIVAIAVISVIFVVASCLLWGYFGSLMYDCGREAYLPQLILEGKILFKDIFGMYNPLSYQINALLYLIFGINTNVLYMAGTVNAFLTLICLYFISRQFVNVKYSTGITIFIMLAVIFNSHDCTNNIFPYAFAMTYATTAMLYSAFLGLLYLKKQKSAYIILSFLLLGISLACKPEYTLCIIPLIGLLIYQKANWKTYLLSVTSFLLLTILSYGILFLQGFTTQDFINYIDFIHRFFDTKEQIYYNKQLFDNIAILHLFINSIIFFSITIILPFLFSKLIKYKRICILLFTILNILIFLIFSKYIIYPTICLSGACVVCFFILLWAVKNKNIPLIYISSFSILACYRLRFILTSCYANYMGLLALTVCLICLFKYINTKFVDTYCKKIIMLSLILYGSVALGANVYVKHHYAKINSPDKQNVLYGQKRLVLPYNDTINWVIQNTNPDDTVLVLPEGLFINYFTKRPTNPKYYHLIPNHISALGEDNIVEDLSKNLPDYFVLNNVSYELYGAEYICKDFGQKICKLIDDNYYPVQMFSSPQIKKDSNPFKMVIFKLKK